jgi:K+-sensing histidine kinase KdpD
VRLAQIISNLLNNAAKYTEVGGNIWLTAEMSDSEVALKVEGQRNGDSVASSAQYLRTSSHKGNGPLTVRRAGLGLASRSFVASWNCTRPRRSQ